ncbi:serine/threonine-protein kinase [Caenimonas koreensis]|uniref:serine/threonine-protein kinase n=1 Tax=Caenimonas koreensis TaxID=367474 RepID=UPI0037835CBF
MNKLGKYQIRRILGKGAMGIVYEGFDPVIERTVAIKTILPSQLAGSEVVAILARFKREAQAAGRLNHPGIVAIYDYGEELAQDISEEEATMMASTAGKAGPERVAFIAMEFIKGRELKDHLEKGGRFPLKEVGRIMGEMLDALDHAHSLGVVHRDMKPANVILLENGRVKVADFGIARVEQSDLTQTGTIMGTPSYMSPEQFMGHPVDGRSDLFSCGVILYQLLTGEKPFTGETSTTIMYKVLREEPTPPSSLNLTLTPALDFVIKKALSKSPADRFQTGRAFADALQDAIAGDMTVAPGAAAAPAPIQFNAPAAAPVMPAATAPATQAAKKPQAAVWAVGAAAVVALAAGGYLLLAPGKKGEPAVASNAPAAAAPGASAAVAAAPAAAPVATEPGTMVISAIGLVDPKDARFNGDLGAAQTEARESAKRQLIDKALALYVDKASLDTNYGVIDQKMLVNSGGFIRTVLQESPTTNANGLVEMQTRAVVSTRAVQKSLNDLSRQERIDFIRNKGDPRISIRIDIANNDGANLARERSQLAENVVKDRIKSFGFRVWSGEGDNPQAANAQAADFAIKGEVKLKQLSMKLPASGLTITKTALTSWTLKAIETATGEEVYLSTKLPSGQTWASEDQALAEIGKLVGDEFSRNFFLEHFNFRTQKTNLIINGLPENGSPLMLRELRAMRTVLDAQAIGDGRFQLQLPEGNSGDIVQDGVLKALNMKLGQNCFTLAGSQGLEVSVAYAPACATPEMRTKLEAGAPAGARTMPAGANGTPGRPAAGVKSV